MWLVKDGRKENIVKKVEGKNKMWSGVTGEDHGKAFGENQGKGEGGMATYKYKSNDTSARDGERKDRKPDSIFDWSVR